MKCIIVMVVLCILLLSLFNNDIIIMNCLCNCYASYAYHIYILILIDEGDRTAVGYVCLWEGTSSGSKFLHLFNACYHMAGRSSEVSLSKFSDIKMENVTDNKGSYDVAMQGIERTKQEPIRRYVYILRKNVSLRLVLVHGIHMHYRHF